MEQEVEIEVKFHVPQVESMRKRILALGASSRGRCFEMNICFEDESRTLKKRDILLRLRRDRKATLTFKAPPEKAHSDFKIYRELEVEVGDFDTCKAILQSLGFSPERVYEKWRETFVFGDTHLLIDSTPYGVFLEIEGRKSHIRSVADQLDLPWEERILLNYLAMFEVVRQGEGLSFKDMTFENFDAVHCDVGPYLSSMYAG